MYVDNIYVQICWNIFGNIRLRYRFKIYIENIHWNVPWQYTLKLNVENVYVKISWKMHWKYTLKIWIENTRWKYALKSRPEERPCLWHSYYLIFHVHIFRPCCVWYCQLYHSW